MVSPGPVIEHDLPSQARQNPTVRPGSPLTFVARSYACERGADQGTPRGVVVVVMAAEVERGGRLTDYSDNGAQEATRATEEQNTRENISGLHNEKSK